MCAKGLTFSPPVVDFTGEVSPSPRFVKDQGDRLGCVCVCARARMHTHVYARMHAHAHCSLFIEGCGPELLEVQIRVGQESRWIYSVISQSVLHIASCSLRHRGKLNNPPPNYQKPQSILNTCHFCHNLKRKAIFSNSCMQMYLYSSIAMARVACGSMKAYYILLSVEWKRITDLLNSACNNKTIKQKRCFCMYYRSGFQSWI